MKAIRNLILVGFSAIALSGCIFGGGNKAEKQVIQEIAGGSNPYLWRASLDTLNDLPLVKADPFGGTIIYDWKSYEGAMDERIKATVYILDSRLASRSRFFARQIKMVHGWMPVSMATRRFSLRMPF